MLYKVLYLLSHRVYSFVVIKNDVELGLLTLKAEREVLSSAKEGYRIIHVVQNHLCKMYLCVDKHKETLVKRLNVNVSL